MLCIFIFSACSPDKPIKQAKVFIKEENGKFTLYRDGKPFYIKGAGGSTNLDKLARAGGNAIRIWDTTAVSSILKEANEKGIAVIIGLPIPESQFKFYYNDSAKVAQQFSALKGIVNQYKNDPAVLMWCVGNELVFPYSPAYNNFYKAFNNIVDMIHKDDPDHPVTTTMVNFQRKEIVNIKVRTDIDLISFNIFSRINSLERDLKKFSWIWDGPYLITEWGIDGPWEGMPQTAWAAYIEPTSTHKAERYLLRYQQKMPVNDPRFLGSFIFYWGQKQETTPTWYSLFDEQGNRTAAVDVAETIWKGKAPSHKVPRINDMLLEGKSAKDNILVKAADEIHAEVLMFSKDSGELKIKWEIYPEDWYKRNNINNLKRPPAVRGLIREHNSLNISFTAPKKEGPYRIFATVYDAFGNIATCNTPFYVLAAQ